MYFFFALLVLSPKIQLQVYAAATNPILKTVNLSFEVLKSGGLSVSNLADVPGSTTNVVGVLAGVTYSTVSQLFYFLFFAEFQIYSNTNG